MTAGTRLESSTGYTVEVGRRLGFVVVKRSSLELVTRSAAELIVSDCEQNGVVVLGMEGFRLMDSSVIPDMNAIADFSDARKLPFGERVLRCAIGSRLFLAHMTDESLMFDIEYAFPTRNPGG